MTDFETLRVQADTLDKVRKQAQALDDSIEARKIALAEELSPDVSKLNDLRALIKNMQADIIESMNQIEVDGFKTKTVRVEKKHSTTYRITNPREFIASVEDLKIPDRVYEIKPTEAFKKYVTDTDIKGFRPEVKEFISVTNLKK